MIYMDFTFTSPFSCEVKLYIERTLTPVDLFAVKGRQKRGSETLHTGGYYS